MYGGFVKNDPILLDIYIEDGLLATDSALQVILQANFERKVSNVDMVVGLEIVKSCTQESVKSSQNQER